jgi:hypothetical protein
MKQFVVRVIALAVFYLLCALAGWSFDPWQWGRVVQDMYVGSTALYALTFWHEIRRKWFTKMLGPTHDETRKRIAEVSPHLGVKIWGLDDGRKFVTITLNEVSIYRLCVPRTYHELTALTDTLKRYMGFNGY